MTRTVRLLLALLLFSLATACGAATPYPGSAGALGPTAASVVYSGVTPVVRDISPQEAGAIVIDATNTAAAVATANAAAATADARQAAVATAAGVSARETATAASLSTLDALAMQQTQTVLQLTAGAGAALATDAAAVRTQRAAATDSAATPAAIAQVQAVYATGTALARAQAAAVDRADDEKANASAWRWGLLFVGLIVVLGLGAAVTFGVSGLFSARERMELAKAERIRAEAMQLMIFQANGQVFHGIEGHWELMEAKQIAPPLPSQGMAEAQPTLREVPVRGYGDVVSVALGVPETPERQRVLDLLKLAINRAGTDSTIIPSAARLSVHPQDWQRAVDLLRPDGGVAYVQTTLGRGGRTTLSQQGYKTLGALRDGIARGDVLPRPTAPLSQATAEVES